MGFLPVTENVCPVVGFHTSFSILGPWFLFVPFAISGLEAGESTVENQHTSIKSSSADGGWAVGPGGRPPREGRQERGCFSSLLLGCPIPELGAVRAGGSAMLAIPSAGPFPGLGEGMCGAVSSHTPTQTLGKFILGSHILTVSINGHSLQHSSPNRWIWKGPSFFPGCQPWEGQLLKLVKLRDRKLPVRRYTFSPKQVFTKKF